MLRQVISDCRMELRHALKQKKIWIIDWCWSVLFSCLLLLPVATKRGIPMLKYGQAFWCFFFCLFMITSLYLSRLYSNNLGKMFYLVPTSWEDRKKYLLAGYWFRVLFLTAVMALMLLIGIVFEDLNPIRAGFLLVNFFMIMCISNINIVGDGADTGTENPVKGKWGCLFNSYTYIGYLVSILLLFAVLVEWIERCTWEQSRYVSEEYAIFTDRWMMGAGFLLEVVAVIPVCLIYWREKLRQVKDCYTYTQGR